jgi:hypothetical protein
MIDFVHYRNNYLSLAIGVRIVGQRHSTLAGNYLENYLWTARKVIH